MPDHICGVFGDKLRQNHIYGVVGVEKKAQITAFVV
jgi:hypothetical protein